MQKMVQSVWRTINNQLRWRTPIQVIRIPEVPKKKKFRETQNVFSI